MSHYIKRTFESRCLLTSVQSFPLNQRGFSFLELLISLLIFAIGFIGLASLQHISFKMTHDSILQASAVSISSSLIDQLRVKGNSLDLTQWKKRVAEELPNGEVELTQQNALYAIKIDWRESEHSAASSHKQSYELTFRLD